MLSLGKPSAVALDFVRGRLCEVPESARRIDFLYLFPMTDCDVESAASSPEASREDGCSKSAVADWGIDPSICRFRLRFPEPEDDGEDMVKARTLT